MWFRQRVDSCLPASLNSQTVHVCLKINGRSLLWAKLHYNNQIWQVLGVVPGLYISKGLEYIIIVYTVHYNRNCFLKFSKSDLYDSWFNLTSLDLDIYLILDYSFLYLQFSFSFHYQSFPKPLTGYDYHKDLIQKQDTWIC